MIERKVEREGGGLDLASVLGVDGPRTPTPHRHATDTGATSSRRVLRFCKSFDCPVIFRGSKAPVYIEEFIPTGVISQGSDGLLCSGRVRPEPDRARSAFTWLLCRPDDDWRRTTREVRSGCCRRGGCRSRRHSTTTRCRCWPSCCSMPRRRRDGASLLVALSVAFPTALSAASSLCRGSGGRGVRRRDPARCGSPTNKDQP